MQILPWTVPLLPAVNVQVYNPTEQTSWDALHSVARGARGNCCYCVRRAKPQSELPSLVERSDSSIFHTRQQCQANPTTLKVIHAPYLTTPILSHTLVTARRYPATCPASARPSPSSLLDSCSSSHLCAHGLTSSCLPHSAARVPGSVLGAGTLGQKRPQKTRKSKQKRMYSVPRRG